MVKVDPKKLEQIEKRILKEEGEIEEAEKNITQEEHEIKESERDILKTLRQGPMLSMMVNFGSTRRHLNFMKMTVVNRVARHKFIFGLTVTTAIVLIWRGIWTTADLLPLISYPLASIVVGLLILWVLEKYTNMH